MNTPTPRTDAETTLMTLDCDDSCVEIYLKRDGKVVEGDFVLADFARQLERELATAEAELSVSNSERDHYRRENAEMREAINEASKRLQSIQLNDIFEETMRYNAALALAKLKPFLK